MPSRACRHPSATAELGAVPFGRAGIRVTPFAFGSAAIGRTEVTDDAATATLTAALDAGVSYVDTAPMYSDGRAERRVGAALAGRARDSYVLSSKVGRLVRPGHPDSAGTGHDWIYDYSRDGILRSLDESLARLGVDHLDIAYIHDCDGHWDDAIRYAWPTLDRLRSEGVVRSIGVGMTQAPMPARFVRETTMDVVLLAGRYSLIDPEGLDELLPLCVERDVSVVAAQTLHGGLIVGGDPSYHYRAVDPGTQAKVEAIRRRLPQLRRSDGGGRAAVRPRPSGGPGRSQRAEQRAPARAEPRRGSGIRYRRTCGRTSARPASSAPTRPSRPQRADSRCPPPRTPRESPSSPATAVGRTAGTTSRPRRTRWQARSTKPGSPPPCSAPGRGRSLPWATRTPPTCSSSTPDRDSTEPSPTMTPGSRASPGSVPTSPRAGRSSASTRPATRSTTFLNGSSGSAGRG